MDAKPEVCEVCDKPANEDDGRIFTVVRPWGAKAEPLLFRVHGHCTAKLDAPPFSRLND